MQPSLSTLRKALATIEKGQAEYLKQKNDLSRDGLIQRFEYTFELSWKVAAKVLAFQGINAVAPRAVFRELARMGWVEKPELWMTFLDSRNQTVHIYRHEVADKIFAQIPIFVKACEELIEVLEKQHV